MLHLLVNEERLINKKEKTLLSLNLVLYLKDDFINDLSNPIQFHVCEKCKKHGRIIGDGIIEGDFYSKEVAKTCLLDLFKKGKIGAKENAMINYQIEKSNLTN